jgi:hypothetical protein
MLASYISSRMSLVRFLRTVPVCDNLSRLSNKVRRMHCSQIHLLVRLSGMRDPPQFLFQHNHWSSALRSSICWWTYYISLLGSYHQHVIITFNICSWGANLSVLNRFIGGRQPWRSRFSTSLSPPFLTDDPPLSPKRPIWSQVNNPTILQLNQWVNKP